MSMIRCERCPTLIDSDDDPDCFVSINDNDSIVMCEPCRDKHEAETFAYGRELAAEHHRDLNAQGCTCQWIGSGNDPDAHIKRDRNCPIHGFDPDAARDAVMDR